jgi:hypothetical protein
MRREAVVVSIVTILVSAIMGVAISVMSNRALPTFASAEGRSMPYATGASALAADAPPPTGGAAPRAFTAASMGRVPRSSSSAIPATVGEASAGASGVSLSAAPSTRPGTYLVFLPRIPGAAPAVSGASAP